MMENSIRQQLEQALEELVSLAKPDKESLLVAGCSTSEIIGNKIGSGGSGQTAEEVMDTLLSFCKKHSLYLAVQCCEHLNRSLVIEQAYMKTHNLTQVNAVPVLHAGGALAERAYKTMNNAVLVEKVQADLGIDIGLTLIGMHLKPVAVPVRTKITRIGQAVVVCARTRPKYIGGNRAVYDDQLA